METNKSRCLKASGTGSRLPNIGFDVSAHEQSRSDLMIDLSRGRWAAACPGHLITAQNNVPTRNATLENSGLRLACST